MLQVLSAKNITNQFLLEELIAKPFALYLYISGRTLLVEDMKEWICGGIVALNLSRLFEINHMMLSDTQRCSVALTDAQRC